MVATASRSPGVSTPIPALGGRTALSRSPEERFLLRFPRLYPIATRLIMSLPPSSRLRRRSLARTIALTYAAANRRDFDLILAGLDPVGYEARPCRELLPPDMDVSYRGRDGYRRFWRLWLEAFPDVRWAPTEILDGDGGFVVTVEQSGHGAGSGLPFSEWIYQVFTLRRGYVLSQFDYRDRDEALASARIDPENP